MLDSARQSCGDDTRADCISGTTDWQGQSYTITGSGSHSLKWRYTKNGGITGGSDCAWVDYVQSPSPTDWLTITYGYDSAGRRIEKAYDGQTVMKYLYDGSQIIAEYDGNNSLLHKYIYGPGVDQPICMIDVEHSSAAYYYHFDGLGSVIALTNSSGTVVNLYEYSVFGEVSASDPNHPNRFLFTGREFDKDTGLYYYRARYYNPYIGRFLQTDPAGQGTNAYAYCGNDPIGFVDPSGEKTIWRERDGRMVQVGYGWPVAFVSDEMMADPTGVSRWTVKNFWWWYVNKGGDMLDLSQTGLLSTFEGDRLIRKYVRLFQREVRQMGLDRWAELDKQQVEWLAKAERYRHGEISAEELGDRPADRVEFDYSEKQLYNFGLPRTGYLNDLVVLGHGWLHLEAKLTVSRFQNRGGMVFIQYNFWFQDWFRDALDILNTWPDDTYGYWEYDNGHPYPIWGAWGGLEHAFKVDASKKWVWTVDLDF